MVGGDGPGLRRIVVVVVVVIDGCSSSRAVMLSCVYTFYMVLCRHPPWGHDVAGSDDFRSTMYPRPRPECVHTWGSHAGTELMNKRSPFLFLVDGDDGWTSANEGRGFQAVSS